MLNDKSRTAIPAPGNSTRRPEICNNDVGAGLGWSLLKGTHAKSFTLTMPGAGV
jgi:hypothetical protein